MVRRLAVVVVLAGVSALALGASGSATQARYSITDLGTLGGRWGAAQVINEGGQIAGRSRIESGERHAFMWANGKMADLGSFVGSMGLEVLLNERGQAAWASARDGAFLWDAGATTRIGPFSNVRAMNDRAQILVWLPGQAYAQLWADGHVRALRPLPGDSYSIGYGVNKAGTVVGQSFPGDDDQGGRARAVAWQDGKVRDLGVLAGFLPRMSSCTALAVNDREQVIGYCMKLSGSRLHGFLWQDGEMRDLIPASAFAYPQLLNERGDVLVGATGDMLLFWRDGKTTSLGTLGGRRTAAFAMNDQGQVVGASQVRSGRWHAFAWEKGRMTDLGTLPGARSSVASAINNKGQIVGTSTKAGYNGPSRPVLWTPR